MKMYIQEYDDGDYVIKRNGITVSHDHVLNTLNHTDKIIKQMRLQMRLLSDATIGHQEGKFSDILQRVTHLKLKGKNVEIDNQFREIADKISELQDLVEDIKADT